MTMQPLNHSAAAVRMQISSVFFMVVSPNIRAILQHLLYIDKAVRWHAVTMVGARLTQLHAGIYER